MKILLLMITALSVSLDSFFCGLTMSIKTKDNLKFILGISLTVFTLCILGRMVGIKAHTILFNYSEIIGGSILIIIALGGIIDCYRENNHKNSNNNILLESVIIGFAIGLDGGAGCISLALSGYDSIIVPIFITAIHILLMNIAIAINNSKITLLFKKFKLTPHLILLLLGMTKLILA